LTPEATVLISTVISPERGPVIKTPNWGSAGTPCVHWEKKRKRLIRKRERDHKFKIWTCRNHTNGEWAHSITTSLTFHHRLYRKFFYCITYTAANLSACFRFLWYSSILCSIFNLQVFLFLGVFCAPC
jgi:hypothetical protein